MARRRRDRRPPVLIETRQPLPSEIRAAAGIDPFGVGVLIWRTADQSIANATDEAVAFTVATDKAGPFWNPDDPSKLFIPASGWHAYGSNLAFASNATGHRAFEICKNSTLDRIAYDTKAAVNGLLTASCISKIGFFEAGEYIQSRVRQNSGGALALSFQSGYVPQMWIARLS